MNIKIRTEISNRIFCQLDFGWDVRIKRDSSCCIPSTTTSAPAAVPAARLVLPLPFLAPSQLHTITVEPDGRAASVHPGTVGVEENAAAIARCAAKLAEHTRGQLQTGMVSCPTRMARRPTSIA